MDKPKNTSGQWAWQEYAAELEKQLDAANARLGWFALSKKPPKNQLVFIEMIMPSGERRFDMMLGECVEDALYVNRWTPAPPNPMDELTRIGHEMGDYG